MNAAAPHRIARPAVAPGALTRLTAAALLSGIALAHVAELASGPPEPAYLAGLFGALVVASAGLAAAVLARWREREALACGAALAVVALAGFLLSRWIGLPGLTSHVGDWRSGASLAALLCEASLVTLAARDAFNRAAPGEGPLRAGLGAGCVLALGAALAVTLGPAPGARGGSASAAAAGCAPGCLLRAPAPDELSVAGPAGPDLVVASARRSGPAVFGRVGVLHAPGATLRVALPGARTRPCGRACLNFVAPAGDAALPVVVTDRGARHPATLPLRWRSGPAANARAAALARRALAVMVGLHSVRQSQSMYAGPGQRFVARFALRSPDRVASTSAMEAASGRVRPLRSTVVIGNREWDRDAGGAWRESPYDANGAGFSIRDWYLWSRATGSARLLGVTRSGGRAIATLALAAPTTADPAWWRVAVDVATGRVTTDRLSATGHYMTNRYAAYDAPVAISPPIAGAPRHRSASSARRALTSR